MDLTAGCRGVLASRPIKRFSSIAELALRTVRFVGERCRLNRLPPKSRRGMHGEEQRAELAQIRAPDPASL